MHDAFRRPLLSHHFHERPEHGADEDRKYLDDLLWRHPLKAAEHLTSLMMPSAIAAAATPGDHHAWPGIWATRTLERAVSAHVYPPSFKNGRINPDTHGGEDSILALIVAPTKNAYIANHVADARAQLLRAAIHLAAILNAINWPQ